jgi:type I restriction enzyme, S subunit
MKQNNNTLQDRAQEKKAFAVWFKDLHRWSVNSFYKIQWHWPQESIAPLSKALKRKRVMVNKQEIPLNELQLITLHFNGEMEPRNIKKANFKGALFEAKSGDVVYSKIDVRNGAIGVVPSEMPKIAVSSEFPVYCVRTEVALPEYLKILLRTNAFKNRINSLISGASGRKRVQPSDLEEIEVPLPSLKVQQSIVNFFYKTKNSIAEINKSIEEMALKLEDDLLQNIGISIELPIPRRGAFALPWNHFERWDTFYYRKDFMHLSKDLNDLSAEPLGKIAHFVSRPWDKSCFPENTFRYIEISSVTKNKGITQCREVPVERAPSRATTIIKTGDLLISTTRPYLGSFAIVPPYYNNCVCTSGFAVIDEVDSNKLEKEFLLCFLKSPAGLRQMERLMTGGLYPAIVQSELEKVLIPLIPIEKQKEFVRLMHTIQNRIEQEYMKIETMQNMLERDTEEIMLGKRKLNNSLKHASSGNTKAP